MKHAAKRSRFGARKISKGKKVLGVLPTGGHRPKKVARVDDPALRAEWFRRLAEEREERRKLFEMGRVA